MKPQWEKLLCEQYEKENKYFRVNDNYFPNYRKPAITGKFYSKYEHLDLSKADPQLVDSIKLFVDKGPREKYEWPETENQVYGWFSDPLVNTDRNDPRLYFPVVTCEITRLEMELKKNILMKQSKFTGVPWK